MSSRTVSALDAPAPILAPEQTKVTTNLTAPPKDRHLVHADNNDQQRRDISVRFHYLKDDPLYETTKPIQITPPFPRSSATNVNLAPGPPEHLNDVRGREGQFTLDDNGFCYIHAPTKFRDWSSQPQIAKEFLPEMEDLLRREIDGCDEIIFYDARIRQESDEGVRVQGLSYNPFARQVHVDNTATSVLEKIHNITDMKADYHLSGRARIINIWRPIKHPVYDCGLAIADGGKLQEGDVLECDRHRKDNGQYLDTMGVIRYRPGFDWYYMSLQDEPDVLLFKNYDSATDVRARYCLHTAFDLPPEEVPVNAPTRESIEVRALIFTNPKGGRRASTAPYPHPLAEKLENSDLKHIDEEHSITDRLRTDIDEGNEVKDAVLLLRRQEIRRLENVREALASERDQLQYDLQDSKTELEQARQQITIQTSHSEALQAKIDILEQRLAQQQGDFQRQITSLSRELNDVRLYEQTRLKTEADGLAHASSAAGAGDVRFTEKALLLERIDAQQLEIEKWKAEAMHGGGEAVSRSWQGSVDEAVRHEREKDSVVIRGLQEEIERLKAGS